MPMPAKRPTEPMPSPQGWTVDVAGQPLTLPIVPVGPDLAIPLMMIIDLGVRFGSHVGTQLARRLAPLDADIVVGTATLGIPVAIELTRALGLDRYVIVQKSPKLHLADARSETITAITSKGSQRLLLDPAAEPLLAGRRVIVVDDVISTGSSIAGTLRLVRAAGAEIVGIGAVLTEGWRWRKTLAADAGLVTALAHIPQFRPGPAGWEANPDTL